MAELIISIDDKLLQLTKDYAEKNGTTVEALVQQHLTGLVGRRRTVREQIYRGYEPPTEVVERLQAEWEAELENTSHLRRS